MGRLIDEDALLKDFSTRYGELANKLQIGFEERLKTLLRITNLIYDQPTVDAVPVVRCKDCVYGSEKSFAHEEICCPNATCYMDFNDYCSLGERKKGDSNAETD